MDIIGVYKLTNKITQESYIGQSLHINHRWIEHKNAINNIKNRKNNIYLYNAIRKYGWENFDKEILVEIREKDKWIKELLNFYETYFVFYYQTMYYNKGYNTKFPGSNGSPSKETIEKQKQSLAKYYETHDGPNKGKKVSEAQLEKMKSIKGEKHWNYGGHISEEHKKAVSLAQKDKPKSEEHKAHMYKIPKGNIPWNKGKSNPESCKSVICIETEEVFISMQEASEKYLTAGTHISQACSGKRKTSGGFHWAYYSN